MWNKIFLLLIIAWIIPWLGSAQCAMCRAVLESEEGQKTAEGINNGILYLMIIPYVLIGFIGFAIYKSRQGRKLKEKLQ